MRLVEVNLFLSFLNMKDQDLPPMSVTLDSTFGDHTIDCIMPEVFMKTCFFVYSKQTQISCTVTAQLMSTFVLLYR